MEKLIKRSQLIELSDKEMYCIFGGDEPAYGLGYLLGRAIKFIEEGLVSRSRHLHQNGWFI